MNTISLDSWALLLCLKYSRFLGNFVEIMTVTNHQLKFIKHFEYKILKNKMCYCIDMDPQNF